MSLREIEPIQPALQEPLSPKGRLLLLGFAFVAGLAGFYPVLRAWFSSEELVLFNAIQHDLFAIWWGADRQPGFFRPVVSLLAYGWESLFGLRAWAFHALSVGLHLINALLVMGVAKQWVQFLRPDERLRGPSIALICGAWFWVWPSHSEPVGWIPGLTDVAAATALLASLWMYLRRRNGGGALWFIGAVATYVVALCTKEAAITLPGVIIIYELMRAGDARRFTRKNIVGPMIYCAIMAAYFLFRRWWMGAFLGGYGGGLHKDFSWEKIHLALAPNLVNAFAPVPGLTLGQKDWLICFVGFAMVAAAVTARRRLRTFFPMVATAAGALVLFLPGINLGPGLTLEGQRFAYIPSALAVISVVYAIAVVLPRRRTFLAVGCLGVLLGATALGFYNMRWMTAGKVAREIVHGMANLPPARKLFVLTTTDSYREAFIMPHSLKAVADILLQDPPARQMPMAVAVNYWRPDAHVQVIRSERDGRPGWLITLDLDDPAQGNLGKDIAPRLDVLNFSPGDWAEVTPLRPKAVFVRPNGFDPDQDRLVYLDGAQWKML